MSDKNIEKELLVQKLFKELIDNSVKYSNDLSANVIGSVFCAIFVRGILSCAPTQLEGFQEIFRSLFLSVSNSVEDDKKKNHG